MKLGNGAVLVRPNRCCHRNRVVALVMVMGSYMLGGSASFFSAETLPLPPLTHNCLSHSIHTFIFVAPPVVSQKTVFIKHVFRVSYQYVFPPENHLLIETMLFLFHINTFSSNTNCFLTRSLFPVCHINTFSSAPK